MVLSNFYINKDKRLLVLILFGCLTLLPHVQTHIADLPSAGASNFHYIYLENSKNQASALHRVFGYPPEKPVYRGVNALTNTKHDPALPIITPKDYLHALTISSKGVVSIVSPTPYYALFFGFPLQINRADKQTLTLLPGIGPGLAERIIRFRDKHFLINDLKTLRRVPGIGPVLIEKLRSLLSFD